MVKNRIIPYKRMPVPRLISSSAFLSVKILDNVRSLDSFHPKR